MCFSAEVSFTAAGALAAAGIYLGTKFWGDRRFMIAITPLLFAIQQFAEGWLWVGLTSGQYPNGWTLFAQYTYLFFAYMLWPVWIALAALAAETVLKKRLWLQVILTIGCMLFAFNGAYLAYGEPIRASIVGHSISYGHAAPYLAILYAAIVTLPFFISSLPNMKIIGALVALTFAIAYIVYTYGFTSIWCFAAAITTLLLLIFLKKDSTSSR